MKKFFSILTPIVAIFLIIGGVYYYFHSGAKNFKEEHDKYIAIINENHDFSEGLKGLETLTTEKAKETLKNIDKEITIVEELVKIENNLKNSNINLAKELVNNVLKLDNEKTFEKAITYLDNNIKNYEKAHSEILELNPLDETYSEEITKIINKYNFNYNNLKDSLANIKTETTNNNITEQKEQQQQAQSSSSTTATTSSNTRKNTTKSNTQLHPRIVGQQVPETYNTIRYTEEGSISRNIIENELKGDISNFSNEEIDEAIASYNAKNGG